MLLADQLTKDLIKCINLTNDYNEAIKVIENYFVGMEVLYKGKTAIISTINENTQKVTLELINKKGKQRKVSISVEELLELAVQ